MAEIKTTRSLSVSPRASCSGASPSTCSKTVRPPHDRATIWAIAGRLWWNTRERDRQVSALADELVQELSAH
jgi:hypothetical protein